jgi:hypothetical protein
VKPIFFIQTDPARSKRAGGRFLRDGEDNSDGEECYLRELEVERTKYVHHAQTNIKFIQERLNNKRNMKISLTKFPNTNLSEGK